MLKYVTLNNVRYAVADFQSLGEGGEGQVFRFDDHWALKLFHHPDPIVSRKLSECVDRAVYTAVVHVAATPRSLFCDSGSVEGYVMEKFSGYTSVDWLANLGYCIENKITIRRTVIVL